MKKMLYILSLLLIPSISFAYAGDYCFGDGHNYMMNSGSFGYFGAIFNLILFFALIAGVVYVIKLIASSGKNKKSDDALEILKNRYAKGEIDEKEFNERKKNLK